MIASVDRLSDDVRFAARAMRRSPGFTAAVALTLGVSVGGTSAAFGVVDALFLRGPEGVDDPSLVRRVLVVRDKGAMQTPSGGPGVWADYVAIRDRVAALNGVAAFLRPEPVDLGRGADASRISASLVSHDFFTVLGVRPDLGRVFLAGDDDASAGSAVGVISHRLWRQRFNGSPDALGQSLMINGQLLTIVGVAPLGFTGVGTDRADLWAPSSMGPPLGLVSDGWRSRMLVVHVVARLQPGVNEAVVIEQLAQTLSGAASSEPSLDQTPNARFSAIYAGVETTAGILSKWLMVVSFLTLTVACANVASLLLARNMARRRDTAIRLSLGAGSARVARLYLTESAMLALLGWGIGLGVAYWAITIIGRFPLFQPPPRLDARLLLFAAASSLLAGLLAGLLPAIRAGRLDAAWSLRGSRSLGGRAHQRVRLVMVVAQMAVALALLIGAGLFIRSVAAISAITPGVDADRILVASLNVDRTNYAPVVREALYERALTRLTGLPSVERASMAHFPPLSGLSRPAAWSITGPRIRRGVASLNLVGPDYFETVGTRVLRGRSIRATDTALTDPVAVVNDATARQMADDGEVVGRCIPLHRQVRDGACTVIVGVVASQRNHYLTDAPVAMIFKARAQGPNLIPTGSPTLLIRTKGDPDASVESVRSALQGLAPDLPFVAVEPLSATFEPEVQQFRLGARLSSAFGGLALILAAVGLYSVLTFFVTERTAEIGLRRALGAPRAAIVAMVVRQTLPPILVGVVIGAVGAWVGSRYVASLLYGVPARDPASFVGATAILVGIALVAVLAPVWRAVRIDPMVTLDR